MAFLLGDRTASKHNGQQPAGLRNRISINEDRKAKVRNDTAAESLNERISAVVIATNPAQPRVNTPIHGSLRPQIG